ncbi:unnamed protein product [Pseudo-nitzschia multistriata]|uniref:Uncharacterized protein n=1 Tax=Pseudo-nitzschia multistriata TaxID=183589 RepID=A0A448ZL07_9STRA|nr:unnamed protein product [Pseudo-nitzschia multistriata]
MIEVYRKDARLAGRTRPLHGHAGIAHGGNLDLCLLLGSELGGGLCLCGGKGSGLLLGFLCGQEGGGVDLFLWLHDGDDVIERDLGTELSLGVVGQEDGNTDSDDSLSHHNVSNGGIGVYLSGVSGLDHVTVSELHSLGTLSPELSGDNDLATLGGGLHDESDNSVARTSDGESSEELELEGLGLGLGAEAAVLDALGVQLDGAIGESESLLDDRGQLTDAASVLSQNVLGAGGPDDDLRAVGGRSDLDTGVTVLGELGNEQFVEFGVEDSVGDELALGRHASVS